MTSNQSATASFKSTHSKSSNGRPTQQDCKTPNKTDTYEQRAASNDEAERRRASLTHDEADLSQSSHRTRLPRSLELLDSLIEADLQPGSERPEPGKSDAPPDSVRSAIAPRVPMFPNLSQIRAARLPPAQTNSRLLERV